MDRLGRELGFADGALWVKRDDLTGLGGGGNKVRKLEFLVGAALAQGCDTLLTCGATQSNHVRLTAAAARASGLSCTAVLGGRRHERADGNVVLDELFGLDVVWIGAYDAGRVGTVLAETAMRLTAEGRHPYEIPLGGASEVGTLGYVVAAGELAAQAPLGSLVYTATGTGGTQTGLVVGLGHHDRVRGVDVGAIPDVGARIEALAAGVASLSGHPLPEGRPQIDQSQIGDGYATRSEAVREALVMAARLEGLIFDPVYSGRALAGLIADRRSGRLAPDQPVVMLHTGGMPALFADRFRDWFADG